jgi:hypothetical protein
VRVSGGKCSSPDQYLQMKRSQVADPRVDTAPGSGLSLYRREGQVSIAVRPQAIAITSLWVVLPAAKNRDGQRMASEQAFIFQIPRQELENRFWHT